MRSRCQVWVANRCSQDAPACVLAIILKRIFFSALLINHLVVFLDSCFPTTKMQHSMNSQANGLSLLDKYNCKTWREYKAMKNSGGLARGG